MSLEWTKIQRKKKLCIVDNPNLVINIWCLICHKTIGAVQIKIQIIHQNQKTVMWIQCMQYLLWPVDHIFTESVWIFSSKSSGANGPCVSNYVNLIIYTPFGVQYGLIFIYSTFLMAVECSQMLRSCWILPGPWSLLPASLFGTSPQAAEMWHKLQGDTKVCSRKKVTGTAHGHSAESNLHASKLQTSSFSCLLNDCRTKPIAPISSGGRPMPAQQFWE